RDRFGDLARALGAPDSPAADAELAAAERRLRDTAAASPYRRVLALSPADAQSVHLARPHTWPELADLTALGIPLVEPPQTGGINWSTTTWQETAALEPDLVLVDARAHAAPLGDHLGAGMPSVPWNPEPAPSARAHARFLDVVTQTLRGPDTGPR
ncbi:ABC transporter substrate-binding protein, partial [Streptomyces sp. T-3]|nr:ABC transporter substrate-binding protein [Streptomyces sp. T-3]